MAMDPEELLPKKKLADIVLGQDLSHLSEHELDGRIKALQAEIERSREAIAARRNTRSAADAFFKK